MKKSLISMLMILASSVQVCAGVIIVNPITVTFNGGHTSFAANGTGSANFVVSVHTGVIPPNTPLTFQLASPGSSRGIVATQVTSATTPLCSGVSNLCGTTFPLAAGQSCCLAFTLTSSAPGSYSLAPAIQTIPVPTYGAFVDPAQSITVASAPTTASISVSPTTRSARLLQTKCVTSLIARVHSFC